jgi:hypothetical protein
MREQHFDLLTQVPGTLVFRRPDQGTGDITCILVHIARDLSSDHVRAALWLQIAD